MYRPLIHAYILVGQTHFANGLCATGFITRVIEIIRERNINSIPSLINFYHRRVSYSECIWVFVRSCIFTFICFESHLLYIYIYLFIYMCIRSCVRVCSFFEIPDIVTTRYNEILDGYSTSVWFIVTLRSSWLAVLFCELEIRKPIRNAQRDSRDSIELRTNQSEPRIFTILLTVDQFFALHRARLDEGKILRKTARLLEFVHLLESETLRVSLVPEKVTNFIVFFFFF